MILSVFIGNDRVGRLADNPDRSGRIFFEYDLPQDPRADEGRYSTENSEEPEFLKISVEKSTPLGRQSSPAQASG
jgi:hypothetical protein